MDKNHPGRQNIDPRLLASIDAAEEEDSLNLSGLKKDDVVSVRTRNTVYTLKMIDLSRGNAEVLINSNGRHVTRETRGRVLGTILTGTGSMVKSNTIVLGLRLCVWVEGLGELRLSATQEVSVNGMKILPIDKTKKVN